MPLRHALCRALIISTSAAALAVTLAPGASATVSWGLPSDTSTSVSAVSAPSPTLSTAGVTPLPAPIGFGAATTGGAGGQLIHVTNAQDSVSSPAAGSLRWAVLQPGPKWIVFDTNVTIALAAPLAVPSDTTIDGRGRQVVITGHGIAGLLIHDVTNVVLESLTLRDFGDVNMTYANDPDDAISIERSSRIWIDHCSLSMAGDKLIATADGAREISLTWNHFYQQQQTLQIGSLSSAANDVNSTVTIAYNHFDHVSYRMPVVAYGKAHVFNNVMDTWGVSGVRSERLAQVYLENNVFIAGSAPKATLVTPGQPCNDGGTMCDDRSGFLMDTGNLFTGRVQTQSTGATHMFDPRSAYSYTAQPASMALAASVTSGSGAVPTTPVAVPLPPVTPTVPSTSTTPSTGSTGSPAVTSVKLKARSLKSGKDRLSIASQGAADGLSATVYRRTGSGAWSVVTTVVLDRRGTAHVVVRDQAPAAAASYVVDVTVSATSNPSRSNVVTVR